MSEPIEKLREMVANWRRIARPHATAGDAANECFGRGILLCADELEALLPALEKRERESRIMEAEYIAAADWSCLVVDADIQIVRTFLSKRISELRAALNPTPCTCDEGVGAFCDQHAKERSEYMEKRKGLRTGMTN